MKIVIDGNDGTGKSFRAEILRRVLPNVPIEDRGILYAATLNENIFRGDAEAVEQFRDAISKSPDVMYVICTCSIQKSQQRILARGGSLEEEFHTEVDLKKYNERFEFLLKLVEEFPNVVRLETEEDLLPQIL